MQPETRETVVQLKGVSKSFGRQAVLNGCDLEVYDGETLVVIGRSGTGKSVTIRHIVGLERPDAGEVLVFGRSLLQLRGKAQEQLKLRLGYLFQSAALLNWMTIEENVELPLIEHRREMTASQRKQLVLDKLRLVEMEDARLKYPAQISGGMKKRAALARAVVLDPDIILYDEPTSGLDPVMANRINDLIIHTAERLGGTQVVVTHDMESAYKVADRIAMLHQGRIVASGTPEEIKQSEDPIVRQFVRGETRGPMAEQDNE